MPKGLPQGPASAAEGDVSASCERARSAVNATVPGPLATSGARSSCHRELRRYNGRERAICRARAQAPGASAAEPPSTCHGRRRAAARAAFPGGPVSSQRAPQTQRSAIRCERGPLGRHVASADRNEFVELETGTLLDELGQHGEAGVAAAPQRDPLLELRTTPAGTSSCSGASPPASAILGQHDHAGTEDCRRRSSPRRRRPPGCLGQELAPELEPARLAACCGTSAPSRPAAHCGPRRASAIRSPMRSARGRVDLAQRVARGRVVDHLARVHRRQTRRRAPATARVHAAAVLPDAGEPRAHHHARARGQAVELPRRRNRPLPQQAPSSADVLICAAWSLRPMPAGTAPPASSARNCSWIWNARSKVSRNSLLPSIEPPLFAENGGKSWPTGTIATALAIRCTGATSVSLRPVRVTPAGSAATWRAARAGTRTDWPAPAAAPARTAAPASRLRRSLAIGVMVQVALARERVDRVRVVPGSRRHRRYDR